MTAQTVVQNPEQGQPVPASPAGNGQQGNNLSQMAEIGSLNDLGQGSNNNLANDPLMGNPQPEQNPVNAPMNVDPLTGQVYNQPQQVQAPASAPPQQAVQNQGVPEQQPQTKDERHAARKITELSESRLSLARQLIDTDAEAIYQLAQDDPELAERMLQEYDYGTENLQELVAQKQNPDTSKEVIRKQIDDDERVTSLEEELMNEKVLRLAGKHPDLKDDLETEFRRLYSNPDFANKDEEQILGIARASLGIDSQNPTATKTDVALDLLKQQEGSSVSTLDTGAVEKKQVVLTDESRKNLQSAGVSESDLEKFLPDNIDDIVASTYKASVYGG